ncbi:Permease of the drug/metabolite transporter (DMT) superfamily protein [Enhygromyxa salina]|uniref:Permease of the drug/metabolite transporter (DMT) superfamily protein n=1 Tax=Enhygromyxa salina TaxID=215803 RepID=A0A0C2CNS1_9BACT|nr:Permease of the drug/metabolite transporter (DMT) superfamily protein [Enhygromyxa salina]
MLAAALMLPASALAGQPEQVDVDPSDPSIFGGAPSATCGWPTTVLISGGGGLCTGTLVHPQLVITAAHCTGNGSNKQIGFGPTGNSRSANATCYPQPNYNGSATNDFAYCVLSQPVNDVPIIPPLFGCETSYISPGQSVEIVGYGQTNQGGAGTKYEVTTTINSYQNGEVYIGGNGKDSCSGDSGGPVYVQLDDGSWRVFGVTSYGGACGGGGYYSNIANNLAWAEQQSGIDISPCHDAQGNWTPNQDCGDFPLDPGSGANTAWAQGCGGGPVSGFSSSCGSPFSPEGDDTAPTVTITAPANGTMYMTGGDSVVSVAISVNADDGAGFGVDHVSLRVDGNDLANSDDASPPYEWTLEFPKGSWEIEAVAVDFSQNMAVSNAVAIGVDQEPDDPPPPSTTDEGDGGGEGDEDSGGDETGGDDGFDSGGSGLPPGFGLDELNGGCACSSNAGGAGGAGGAGALGLFGLLALVRRRRPRAH